MRRESLSEVVVVEAGAAASLHGETGNSGKLAIGKPGHDGQRQASWECLAQSAKYRASELARIAGVSLRTLQRYFRARHNCTVTDWLRELRLEVARRRLTTCNSVKEVAFDLGYKQASHFTRDFKGRYGVPPGALVKGRVEVHFSR